MSYTNSKIVAFRKVVRNYYAKEGRGHLPWRKTRNPYRILVSEIMLQQTQADRVVPYFRRFIKRFPTVAALARAPLSDVLRLWQGLGYNRRAKMLHDAAKAVVLKHRGTIPRDHAELNALPGVGPYTAGAVRAFAWNEPGVLIETNIRAVYIHHFFPKKKNVSDKKLQPYMDAATDTRNPREWFSALMDYGSHLKKTVPNPSRKSTHHTKQKQFKGSDREIRGAILRELADGAKIGAKLLRLPFDTVRIKTQLEKLRQESLVVSSRTTFSLPG